MVQLRVLAWVACAALMAACDREQSASQFSAEITRVNDCEKLRHAVDAFKTAPSPASEQAVIRELAAVDQRIQSLADKAEIADEPARSQLLLDTKALRCARTFNLDRFKTRTDSPMQIAKAEKAPAVVVEAMPVQSAQANIEVRRATAVLPAVAEGPQPANVPVRRAIAVSQSAPSRRVMVITQSPGRITIWQTTDDRSDLARR